MGCFHLLAIVNNAAVNIDAQVSVWIPAFSSFGYVLEVQWLEYMLIFCLTVLMTFDSLIIMCLGLGPWIYPN